MKVTLRLATLYDLNLLKYWDEQPHVLQEKNLSRPDETWHWETELQRNVAWRELLIGAVDGKPVASIQLIDPLLGPKNI